MPGKLRHLASDTLIYGVFTVVGRFLTFMLTPIYTNYLSKEEVGDILYIFSILAFMNIVYSFGMESAFMRFHSKDSEESSKRAFTLAFITITTISLIFSGLVIVFSGQAAPYVTELPGAQKYVILGALIPLLDATMLLPYAFLRMTHQPKKFAVTRFVLIIIAVALNLIFVVGLRWGMEGVFYAQVLASLCGAAIFLRLIIKNLLARFDKKLLWEMLKFGLPTIPASLSAIVLQVADRPILKHLTNAENVAVYSVNYRLGIPMMLFVSVYEYAWKPFYLNHFSEEGAKKLFSRALTYFTLCAAGVFLATGLFIEFIVRMPFIGGRFIEPGYWQGMGIIPIILIGYYFNGLFNSFAAGFHIEKQTQYLPLAIGAGALVNIIINFSLIPVIGYWGAAFATLISYAISAAFLLVLSKKVYPMKYEWFRLFKIIFVAAIVYISAVSVSAGLSLEISFGIRFAGLIVFIIALYFLGFFRPNEIELMKKLFRIKRNS